MQQYSRKAAISRLLESYKAYYNITKCEDDNIPLKAVCEFYERSEKFVLSRKAELWSANCEEFIYLFDVDNLTEELFEKCKIFAKENGLQRANIGPGHMYTYITPIFICNNCSDEVKKLVKKCRIYQSFKFSFHGWMDYHVAVFDTSNNNIFTNRSGRCVKKVLNNVLFK
ncbi:MAG: hypothetical protein II193_05470 [Lachnospiraceae bacterium]|nr:hypothetical protein [Lachnospiraceae bacterium]